MFRRLLPFLKLVAWIAFLYLGFDLSIIRSGLWFRYLEPESTSGAVILNEHIVERRLDPTRRNILVLGDSQVGEGFSAKLANEQAKGTDLNFIGCGISGSTPRIWRYFLRKIDPERQKFAAVVLMTAAFTDDEGWEDFANRGLDMNYCLPLTRWSDLETFPETYSQPALRLQAAHSIAFPTAFAQNDFKAFLSNPKIRIKKVDLWSHGYPDWIYDYPARPDSLAKLVVAGAPAKVENWDTITEPLKTQIQGYVALTSGQYPRPSTQQTAEYRRQWYGRIASDYRARGVPVYVFLMPRGPFHRQLSGDTELKGVFAEFQANRTIQFLDAHAFTELEIPENFFDQLHLNAKGRARLTQLVANGIIEAMR